MIIENNVLKKVFYEDIENGTGTIPDNVTEIGSDAFEGRKNLTSIDIPNNVKYIQSGAFAYCTFLKTVHIPDNISHINNWTFMHCRDLISINIPDSVQWIGDLAFEGCEDLEYINVPNSITHIGTCAFGNCKNLISINIPNNVTYIGEYAFTNCEKLIKKGNFKACNITYNSDEIIYSCLNTEYEIGKQMTTINNIECGKRGYHYVKNLYDIFNCYYGNLNDIALFEIEAGDIIKKDVVDDLYVTNTIKLVRQIPWREALKNIYDF